MADYKPDRRGVAGLMRSAAMHVAMIDAAFDAIPFAKSISPDAPPYGQGYLSSFEVDGSNVEKIAGTRRAVAYLVNHSRHATAVELGWDVDKGQFANHRGYHVLSITADIISNGSKGPG